MSNRILIEPHYWGNITFFHALFTADEVILDINSNFEKASYRNRCNILSPNGKLILSVPVQRGKEQRSVLKDVKISYTENWVKDHWQSLVSSYRRSAYFEFYEDEIWAIYESKPSSLKDINMATIQLVYQLLAVKNNIFTTERYIPDTMFDGRDLRNAISPKVNKSTYYIPESHYQQVFMDRMDFVPQMSILDVLFNLGPRTKEYILGLK